MTSWTINHPEVMAEFRATFDRYEQALVGNDVATLDALFWDSPETVRYGFSEEQYGMDAVRQHRAMQPPQGFPRELLRTAFTTLGPEVATAHVEFWRPDVQRRGRQTQTWIRTAQGWRVVSAHVSWGASPSDSPTSDSFSSSSTL